MTPSHSHQPITVEEYYTRARMRTDRYRDSQACGPDALLVIEVSDTTLHKDLHVKTPLYARHGVPEVWIIDLANNRIRFHREPQGSRFRDVTSATQPGNTPVAGLRGAEIDLAGAAVHVTL